MKLISKKLYEEKSFSVMLADLNASVKDDAQKLADTIDTVEIKDQKSFAKMIKEKRDAMIKNHFERIKKHFEEMNNSDTNNTKTNKQNEHTKEAQEKNKGHQGKMKNKTSL